MARRIALYGGSFNPPGENHLQVAECVAANMTRLGIDELVVVPCGWRPEKLKTNDVDPVHRAAMCVMMFARLANTRVDTFDLENDKFTPLGELDRRFTADGTEVLHVVGSDLIVGGAEGKSEIQLKWINGRELWQKLHFAVVPRQGFPVTAADLPPHGELFKTGSGEGLPGSSTDLRTLMYHRRPYDGLVTPEVGAYVERYDLYRGQNKRTTRLKLENARPFFYYDDRNPEAVAFVKRYPWLDTPIQAANCIVAVGGDGTMLRAVREHWWRYLPFVGVNKGHVGYLLNDTELFDDQLETLLEDLVVHQLMQLSVNVETISGEIKHDYAFNDAWIRDTGQSVWMDISVDGETFELVGDGALVATPAGSTGYAKDTGAAPLACDRQEIVLAGLNIRRREWEFAHLPASAAVKIASTGGDKRAATGSVDGRQYGIVRSLDCRTSRVAGVELAFSPKRDLAAKLRKNTLPRTRKVPV